jgi:hypothetical protein
MRTRDPAGDISVPLVVEMKKKNSPRTSPTVLFIQYYSIPLRDGGASTRPSKEGTVQPEQYIQLVSPVPVGQSSHLFRAP